MKFLSILALAAAVSAAAIPDDDWNKWAKETQYVTVTVTAIPEKQIEYKTEYKTETKYGMMPHFGPALEPSTNLIRNQDGREAG